LVFADRGLADGTYRDVLVIMRLLRPHIHLKYLLNLFSSMSCYLDRPTGGEAHSNGRQGRQWERRFTSSMAKTLVLAISMLGPASSLISRDFSWSCKNIPRRLTLAGPKASCTTTFCPIHDWNAFCMSTPRGALCQRAGSMGDGQSKRYCQKLQSSISW